MPISGLSGAPPDTSALSRPPKRACTLPRTSRSSTRSNSRSPSVSALGILDALAADAQRGEEQLGLEPALALDAAQDALVHGLIEPRHRRHDGRAHLDHVAGQRLDALGEIDLGAQRDREHQPAGVLVGMRQRQEREEDLVAEADGLEQAAGAIAIGEDIAVRGHHALGQAAGARGVDDAGEIVMLDGGGPALDLLGRSRPARQHILPEMELGRPQS